MGVRLSIDAVDNQDVLIVSIKKCSVSGKRGVVNVTGSLNLCAVRPVVDVPLTGDIGLGIADLERIEVVGKPIDDVAIPFKPHQWIEQQYQWQDPEALHHIRL